MRQVSTALLLGQIRLMMALIGRLSAYWRAWTKALIDALPIRGKSVRHGNIVPPHHLDQRAALYVRVSTADKRPDRREPATAVAGGRWTAWVEHRGRLPRRGYQWSRAAQKRPGLDALLKGVARREFDLVAAWSVCRLGRSLPDLIGLLGELQARDVDLFLHQQAIDTITPTGRALFGMLGVFASSRGR